VPQDPERLTSNPDQHQSLLADFFAANFRKLSEIYSGILHAFHSDAFPNQCRVLAYQARELMDKAPRIMSLYGATVPDKPPSFADLRKHLGDEYSKIYNRLERDPMETRAGQDAVRDFLGFIESWLLKVEQARPDIRKLARSHVIGLEPGSAPPHGKSLEIAVTRWIAMKDEFNSILHGEGQETLAQVKALVSDLEDFFLFRLRPRTFENQTKIDQYLSGLPDDLDSSQIAEMLDLIGALGVNYRYFFQHLDAPIWVDFLEEQGFFRHPPEPFRIKDQIYFPDWPELSYLKRVTITAPSTVGPVARRISKLQVENPRTHEDLIAIATLLIQTGSVHGRELLNSELNWLATQERMLLRLPSLLLEAAIASAEQIPGLALRTLRSVLSIEVSDDVRNSMSSSSSHRTRSWDLREVLVRIPGQLLPLLPDANQMHLLGIACEFLLLVGAREADSQDLRRIDTSFLMWRPAIEDHEQNGANSLRSWVIEAVRDIAEALLEKHGTRVLDELERHGSRTLFRVSLYLRRVHTDIDPLGAAEVTGRSDILGDCVVQHELSGFLQEHFTSLPRESQVRYFNWLSKMKDCRAKQKHMWPIRESLSDTLLGEYRSYEAEFGELEHPDFPIHHGIAWIGPTSPTSLQEMKEMLIPELVSALNSWEYTPGDWHAPEPEGLARELASFASEDSGRVSAQAIELKKLQRPIYIRGIVQGLADAVKGGHPISWEPVLEFCHWAVSQERGEGPEGSGLEEFDRTWGPARKQIARLLQHGTSSTGSEVPFILKEQVWAILSILVQDSDPTEEEEASRAEYSDPSTIAINTTRGVALGAVFSYALWVTRHEKQQERSWAKFGLSSVQHLLEQMLESERSPAVRSLFGKWLPYVLWIDQAWTEARIATILPVDRPDIWEATWDSYLMFTTTLYLEFWELLHDSYAHALELVGKDRLEQLRPANPDERLGGQLLLFYRYGAIGLDEPVLRTFFDKARSRLRYSVMIDAVRGVQDVPQDKKEAVGGRLKKLWEWRAEISIGEKAEEHQELAAFAWWFLKDEFDSSWRLQQLRLVQEAGIELQLDGRVLEKLTELASDHLEETIVCLDTIARNPENDHWGLYEDHAKEILRLGLRSEDEDLSRKAEELVHYIGALGFLSFRELLEGDGPG